jgi:anti-sigma B factor antagonist
VEELATRPTTQLRELDVLRKHIKPDVVLVELAGKIVYGPECRQIEWLTAELLDEGERKIIFDLCRVIHIDSSGIGILVMCSGKTKEAGGQLRVAGAEGHVETVMKITQVGKILALYPSTADALVGFAGTAA